MTSQRLKIDAFGRRLDIERRDDAWVVYVPGNEGKRRRARDIVIPSHLARAELAAFLDDLLHESASHEHPSVVVVE